jgi:hypothetical protein
LLLPWECFRGGGFPNIEPKLSSHYSTQEEVLAITGFCVGTVPPFAHRTRLRTLVDAAVLNSGEKVVGGGGDVNTHVVLEASALLEATCGEAVVLREARGEAPLAAAVTPARQWSPVRRVVGDDAGAAGEVPDSETDRVHPFLRCV